MKAVEFRDRSKRAPGGDFRLVLGQATGRAYRRLVLRRELCQRIAKRGEWDVLQAVKDGVVTIEHVERLVDQRGIEDYRRHLTLNPRVLAPTLDMHVERWLSTITKNGTKGVYEPHLRRLRDFEFQGTRLGDMPWPAIGEHHVGDAYAQVTTEIARNTARTCLGAWGSFYTWAVKRERAEAKSEGREPRIAASPVREAGVWGQPHTTRHRFFDREEFARLLEVSDPVMRAQYAMLVYTGLRIREFIYLPPEHMKLPDVVSVGPWGSWAPKGYPKNTRGVRDIPIHRGALLPALEEYAEEWAGDETFFVNPTTGERWRYGAFAKQMARDVKAAGMVYGQRSGGKFRPDGVTPHTFRHTFATWLCQLDVSLVKVAKLMGDTVDTIIRHYIHHVPTDLDRAVNSL